jgi:hypothetical protein
MVVQKASSQKGQVDTEAEAGKERREQNSEGHSHKGRKDCQNPQNHDREIQSNGEKEGFEKEIEQESGEDTGKNSREVTGFPIGCFDVFCWCRVRKGRNRNEL